MVIQPKSYVQCFAHLGVFNVIRLLLLFLDSFLQQLLLAGLLLLLPLGGGSTSLTHLHSPELQVGLLIHTSLAGSLLLLASCLFRTVSFPAWRHETEVTSQA